MKKLEHIIKLDGYSFDKGKLPLKLLTNLNEHLTHISKSALRLITEGYSYKTGKVPSWIEKALDFDLNYENIKEGSKIFSIEAPLLSEVLPYVQTSLFIDESMISPDENTAISLAMTAIEHAFSEDIDTPLLDKHLLKEMSAFQSFFNSEDSFLSISFRNRKPLELKNESFTKIRTIEESTPSPQKKIISGKLDLMKHSTSLLELITENKRIKAILSSAVGFGEAKEFFGKEITVEGVVNFNPAGRMTVIEVKHIREAANTDEFFKKIPVAIQETISIPSLIKEKQYMGIDRKKFDKLIDELDIQEDTDELLKMIG